MMDRNEAIYNYKNAGHTLQETGERFGISRNRVAQIVHNYENKECFDLFQELKRRMRPQTAGKLFTFCRWANIYTVKDLKERAGRGELNSIPSVGSKSIAILEDIVNSPATDI